MRTTISRHGSLRAAALGGLLLVLSLGAARPARADAVEDLAKVLDAVGALPGVPVTGSDVRASRDLFACLDAPPAGLTIAGCIDKFNSTPLGQKALGLPSWFHTLVRVYADIQDGDFWGLVKDAGYTIACAAANIVFGIDVCGVAQAILETIGAAKEILSDVIGFIGDVGGSILKFFGIGGGSDGPPLWQSIFNDYLKPHIGDYAEDWFERPAAFKTEFDVTGAQAQSLVCTIAQKRFGWTCAKLFASPSTLSAFDRDFQGWFRGDTIYAVQMAQAQALAQAVARLGKRANEWLQFRKDWLAERAPADRLRKAYGIWSPTIIRMGCLSATGPWKSFFNEIVQPDVKAQATKALAGLPGFAFQQTYEFCNAYETALKPDKLKSCSVVGAASETALKLDCEQGPALASCHTAEKGSASTKFPPPFDLECATHAIRMADQKTGVLGPKPPNVAPTPAKPVGLPVGPSPH